MDPLKKVKIVTGVCGVLTFGLLATTILVWDKIPVSAKYGNNYNVSVMLNTKAYDNIKGIFTAHDNVIPEDVDFVTFDDYLWILINGVQYPVVESDDGLKVITSDSDMGAYDADGNVIVSVTEDGLLIVGYDVDGNPIYGTPISDAHYKENDISDLIGANPYISVDEEGNRYYHVVRGDTLCKISSLVHYSVDELAEYNHIRNVHLIYAESDLRIPDWESEDCKSDESETEEVKVQE